VIACLVTTYNRPEALARSLPQIAALGAPVLVVDDGSKCDLAAANYSISSESEAAYLRLPENRGLAAAMNIGLSYWLADSRITAISYFQDDVDVHKDTLKAMPRLEPHGLLVTGHDAAEHKPFGHDKIHGIRVKVKNAIRATHMHAPMDFWKLIIPIPTCELGAPKHNGDGRKGIGSNVDWWIVRDSPHSTGRQGRAIICAPGFVRSFYWKGENSCWNNTAKAGEEPPLRISLLDRNI
jgi:glycosyltransferase involved in cell wall biosynthesis